MDAWRGSRSRLPAHTPFTDLILGIRDAVTDAPIARFATEPNEEASAVEWAPDSSAVLMAVWTLTPAICQESNSATQPAYWLLPTSGAAAMRVADVEALRRQWYGDDVVELACETYGSKIAPSTGGQIGCRDGNPAALTIAGKNAGMAVDVRTLGVLR